MASSSSTHCAKPAAGLQSSNFPFLVHSQRTVPFNLPPSVDNKPLARQKRKRTSPEDQAILEAEFLRDPRPDKAARCRIQQRVALGDKEVQIWFQNRRQNTRRKARPLEPHEILSHLQSSSPLSQFHQHSAEASPSSSLPSESNKDALSTSSSSVNPQRRGSCHGSRDGIAKELAEDDKSDFVLRHRGTANTIALAPYDLIADSDFSSSSSAPHPSSSSSQNPVEGPNSESEFRVVGCDAISSGQLDQKSICKDSLANKIKPIANIAVAPQSAPCSKVRLSMTKDGNARIVTGDESSPSPPKARAAARFLRNGPRRSQSELFGETAFAQAPGNNASPALRRGTSGLSRDSRAWEFWCDNDARNELVKKAEQEQSGSAADAIGLMRSNSRGALTPNLSKINPRVQRHNSGVSSTGDGFVKRKSQHLRRSMSSVGRLQTSGAKNSFSKSSAEHSYSPSGDSDKENIAPGMQIAGESRLLPVESRKWQRSVLGECTGDMVLNNAVGLHQLGSSYQHTDSGSSPLGLEGDDEVPSFAARGGCSTGSESLAGEDDLDCVQGLLSLSQGNWS